MNMFEVLVSISFNFFSSKLPNTFHHFYPLQSFPGVLVQLCFHHRFHHFLWKWKGFFPLRFTLQHILWGPVFFFGGGGFAVSARRSSNQFWMHHTKQQCKHWIKLIWPAADRAVVIFSSEVLFVCLFCYFSTSKCRDWKVQTILSQWPNEAAVLERGSWFSSQIVFPLITPTCFLLVKHGKSRGRHYH